MILTFVECSVSQDGFADVAMVSRYVREAVCVSKRYDTMKDAVGHQQLSGSAGRIHLLTVSSSVYGKLDHHESRQQRKDRKV